MNFRGIFIVIGILLSGYLAKSQSQKIDSLYKLYQKSNSTKTKTLLLIDLADEFSYKQIDSANFYINKAILLAEKENFIRARIKLLLLKARLENHTGKPEFAQTYLNKALLIAKTNKVMDSFPEIYTGFTENFRLQSKLDSAFYYANLALTIYKNNNNLNGQALVYNGMGTIMRRKGNLAKALAFFNLAIKLSEETNNIKQLYMSTTNLALVYDNMGDLNKSLLLLKGVYLNQKKLNLETDLLPTVSNMGTLYADLNNFDSALICYKEVIDIAQKLKNKKHLGSAFNNIASLYYKKGDFTNTKIFMQKAIEIKREVGDLTGLSNSLANMGDIFGETKDFRKALTYYHQALEINLKTNDVFNLKNNYSGMAECYRQIGEYKEAFQYLKLFKDYSDTIYNSENTKTIREMQTKYDTEAKEKENHLLNEKNLFNEEKINQQQNKLILLSAFILVVASLSFFLFRSNHLKKKANQLLVQQKEELSKQKDIITHKNKEITDSIRYAQKIQSAILPTIGVLKNVFNESFIYYKPKDIVGGDFYWIEENENYLFYATADCTGHGVPGGFMTMLGMSFLDEIVVEMKINEPNKILNKLRERLIQALNQKGATLETKDGMDMVLIRFNKTTKELDYAAANNSFYVVRNQQILELAADKQPVGFFMDTLKPFTARNFKTEKGDVIYTFTDGFADQFGGEKGKKYKYKKLKELFLSIAQLPTEKQDQQIGIAFETWKNDLEQVDDVLIIGLVV